MSLSLSRRRWLGNITAGMTGLLASERLVHEAQAPTPAPGALVDPRSAIKITRIEIIPVNTLRTIFIKMHTDAGVVGIGEGIVGTVASMHACATIPNFLAHELPSLQAAPNDGVARSYLGRSYITKPLTLTAGHVVIKSNFDGPGLGIALDDNLIENERNTPEWEFPTRSDSFDGSVLDH